MSHPVLVLVPGTIFTEEEYARFITGNMELTIYVYGKSKKNRNYESQRSNRPTREI